MSEMVVPPCLHEENTLALQHPFCGYQGYHVQYYFRKLRFFLTGIGRVTVVLHILWPA